MRAAILILGLLTALSGPALAADKPFGDAVSYC